MNMVSKAYGTELGIGQEPQVQTLYYMEMLNLELLIMKADISGVALVYDPFSCLSSCVLSVSGYTQP